MADLNGFANGLAHQAVSAVTIRSNATPDVRIDPWAGSGGSPKDGTGGGFGGLLFRLLQPEIIVQSAAGPIPVRPWGEPTGAGGLVAIGIVVALGYVALRALRVL